MRGKPPLVLLHGIARVAHTFDHLAPQLKRTLPQIEIVTMPGLGRYPSDEKPDACLTIVDRVLNSPNAP